MVELDIKTVLFNDEDELENKIDEMSRSVKIKYQSFANDENYIFSKDELDPKLIGEIEKIIRSSYEYKKYIGYLKGELDITTCKFIKQVDVKTLKGVSLEFHHYPFTLFDITEAIATKLISARTEEDGVSLFEVADIVMQEHFRHNIGLVPLSKTVHEMAHSGSIDIPIDYVYGNHSKFYTDYKDYLSSITIKKYRNILVHSNNELNNLSNQNKLKKLVTKFEEDKEDENPEE